MLFNLATGYALQALSDLPEDGSYRLAKDLAEKLNLPGPFLSKTLQSLVRANILESVRGRNGGFRLARPAHHITINEVVEVLEGRGAMDSCVMGFPSCQSENPCPMHDAWAEVKAQVHDSMIMISVRDLQLAKLRRAV